MTIRYFITTNKNFNLKFYIDDKVYTRNEILDSTELLDLKVKSWFLNLADGKLYININKELNDYNEITL